MEQCDKDFKDEIISLSSGVLIMEITLTLISFAQLLQNQADSLFTANNINSFAH